MSEPALRKAVYEDLFNLPENMVGEIINGELYAMPRPSPKHANVTSSLLGEIWSPYRLGCSGGPGGWWILVEPELQLGEHTMVPDLAGWKKERMPSLPTTNWFSIPPDWICEVLSPSTMRIDRMIKMPIYAQYGVRFFWMINPLMKTLDIFRLESGRWVLLNTFMEDDKVRGEPFEEVEINLKYLWADRLE